MPSDMSEIPQSARPALFDASLIAGRRNRAHRLGFAGGGDFLHREVAAGLADRLRDVTRRFEAPVLIGSGGYLAEALSDLIAKPRILELSPARAAEAGVASVQSLDPLPVEPASADLVISTLELHWANDPVGQLIQMRRSLKPDGLMIAALFGGQTLAELRACLAEAEVAVTGGLSPRIAPMGELRDLGGLIQRAGFALPVADSERTTVTYADLWSLMRDLRAMGETNILADRRKVPLRRSIVERAQKIYADRFATPEGRLSATFEVVYLTGWAPAPDQPQPLRPGRAQARLADALGTTEVSAGERAQPSPPKTSGKKR